MAENMRFYPPHPMSAKSETRDAHHLPEDTTKFYKESNPRTINTFLDSNTLNSKTDKSPTITSRCKVEMHLTAKTRTSPTYESSIFSSRTPAVDHSQSAKKAEQPRARVEKTAPEPQDNSSARQRRMKEFHGKQYATQSKSPIRPMDVKDENVRLPPKERKIKEIYGENSIGEPKSSSVYTFNPEAKLDLPSTTDWGNQLAANSYENPPNGELKLDQQFPKKKKVFELDHVQSKDFQGKREQRHPNPISTKKSQPIAKDHKPFLKDNSNEERRRKDHQFTDILNAQNFPKEQKKEFTVYDIPTSMDWKNSQNEQYCLKLKGSLPDGVEKMFENKPVQDREVKVDRPMADTSPRKTATKSVPPPMKYSNEEYSSPRKNASKIPNDNDYFEMDIANCKNNFDEQGLKRKLRSSGVQVISVETKYDPIVVNAKGEGKIAFRGNNNHVELVKEKLKGANIQVKSVKSPIKPK